MKETETAQAIDVQAELDRLGRKSTRMEAIVALGQARAVEAVEPLFERCKRAKGEERAAICRALAQIGSGEPSAIELLVREGLGDKAANVRRCAACALADIGPAAQAAFEALLQCLEDADCASPEDAAVRLEVVRALGRIGDPRAVEPLLTLLDDADRDVRQRAADALGDLGDVATEATCQAFETAESLSVRIVAARALGRIGDPRAEIALRQAFADGTAPPELRAASLAALEGMLGAGVVPLAASLLYEESLPGERPSQEEAPPRDEERAPEEARGAVHLRRQAVRCLLDVDTPQSTAHLAALYQDADKKVRTWALRGLQARYRQLLARLAERPAEEGERTLPALLAAWRAMGKKQAQEADEIAQALIDIGPPLVPALCAVLDPDAPGRDVIHVLARMGPAAADAHEALVAQLDNPDVATCCAAARALGMLGDKRSIPVLAARLSFDPRLLQGKKRKVDRRRALALQRAAALGLGHFGKGALVAALEAARSDDPIARRGGAMALGHIGGGRALAALDQATADPDPLVREAAAEATERAAAGDVRRLGQLLQDSDERVRVKAVKALSKLDDLRSLDLLLRAYGDPSTRVNKAVVKALARREGGRAHSMLIAAAAGGDTTALRALEKHPTPQAVPALLEALDAPWYEVYSVALRTLCTYVDLFAEDVEAMAAMRQAIPELIPLLHDESARARRLALETLAAFREPSTVRDVALLLTDKKRGIRLAAVQVLESIGGQEAVATLQAHAAEVEDEDLLAEIAEALERMTASEPK